jgi:hypothetical protein
MALSRQPIGESYHPVKKQTCIGNYRFLLSGRKRISFAPHHRVSDSEDWDLRMLLPHQLDVIEDVVDVVVDRLDVNAVPIAHSVSNCVDG